MLQSNWKISLTTIPHRVEITSHFNLIRSFLVTLGHIDGSFGMMYSVTTQNSSTHQILKNLGRDWCSTQTKESMTEAKELETG